MPTSLIVVALVLAWLVVLVPIIVRRRQEIARTADSALAARVVRSARDADVREEDTMRDADEVRENDEPAAEGVDSTADRDEVLDNDGEPDHGDSVHTDAVEDTPMAGFDPDVAPVRRYRPGRGGFDPEAAALTARAKYAFRQRVVLSMLVFAVITALVAGFAYPVVWWVHGVVDFTLACYLVYLRRQVRIEEEIRERRLARIKAARRARARQPSRPVQTPEPEQPVAEEREPARPIAAPPPQVHRPGAVVVDVDDEDPAFDELDEPHNRVYRRAVGE